MTTEYHCSCHIDGKTYTFITCNAVTIEAAIDQFRDYVNEATVDQFRDYVNDVGTDPFFDYVNEAGTDQFSRADGLILDRIEE